MKLLLDSCIGRTAALQLRVQGHDVVRIVELGSDPGDTRVAEIAWEQDRILVTADKDFGELAIVFGVKHHGIIRISGIAAKRHAAVIESVIGQYSEQLSRSALVTIEPSRIRVREQKQP